MLSNLLLTYRVAGSRKKKKRYSLQASLFLSVSQTGKTNLSTGHMLPVD